MSKILAALSLRHATLRSLEMLLGDRGGEERQPASRKFVFSDERTPRERQRNRHKSTRRRAAETGLSQSNGDTKAQTLKIWQGQDPAERIANTILLCAIRDRAHRVSVEPGVGEVRVQFLLPNGVREQKLPRFALQPILRHFQSLASDDKSSSNVESFAVSLAVDAGLYDVQFSPFATQWGEGVTMHFFARE